MSERAEIFEVGPRDGLQNEKVLIPTAKKVKLINLLSDCGFRRIEVASFVSPKWVPQMSDARDVLEQIDRRECVSYAALTPNLRGFEGALGAKANEIAIFTSASEGFSQANINCSIGQSIERFKPVAEAAESAGMRMRGYISCVTDCPFDGDVSPEQVVDVALKLQALGCYEISLGDTIGRATPKSIRNMLSAVTSEIAVREIAGHYHDTSGCALDNIRASLDAGVRVFDASAGGLGGCPYAPGASGNVASEAVAEVLHGAGYKTGLDLSALEKATAYVGTLGAKED